VGSRLINQRSPDLPSQRLSSASSDAGSPDRGCYSCLPQIADPSDQVGQAGKMFGLDMGLDHGGDTRALALGGGDVFVHEVGVSVDDCELGHGVAAEQARGTGGAVV
jgi:hypothetical protein